jgi:TPR repeat protein
MMKRLLTFMRKMNATCTIQAAVSILALALAGPVIAGPWEDAKVAYDRQDYAAAVRILKPIADQGDPFAQNNIGSAYQNGRGVPQDYVLAMQWYRKAADQGNALAQYNLGAMYDEGRGKAVQR